MFPKANCIDEMDRLIWMDRLICFLKIGFFLKSVICFLKIYYMFPKSNCIDGMDRLIWIVYYLFPSHPLYVS